jgi:hypothetical protein
VRSFPGCRRGTRPQPLWHPRELAPARRRDRVRRCTRRARLPSTSRQLRRLGKCCKKIQFRRGFQHDTSPRMGILPDPRVASVKVNETRGHDVCAKLLKWGPFFCGQNCSPHSPRDSTATSRRARRRWPRSEDTRCTGRRDTGVETDCPARWRRIIDTGLDGATVCPRCHR